MGEPTNDIARQVVELELVAQSGTDEELGVALELSHPADLAEYLRHAEEAPAKRVLEMLDADRSAEILSTLDGDDQERILALLKPQEVAPIRIRRAAAAAFGWRGPPLLRPARPGDRSGSADMPEERMKKKKKKSP